MRLAKFELTNGIALALWPEGLDLSDEKPTRIFERGGSEDWEIKGTFDEAVDEIETALQPNWEMVELFATRLSNSMAG